MKKFLLLIAAMLLCLALVACGDEPKDPAGVETGDETGTQSPVVDDTPKNKLPDGIKAEDYHFFKTFDLPADFRQAAVDFMRKQAAVVWSPEYTFKYGNKFDNWGFEITYQSGVKYTGLPYGSMNSSVEEFQKYLDEHRGKYATNSQNGYYDVMGTQCNTAINRSLQQFYPEADGESKQYMPSYSDLFVGKKVGNYVAPEGVKKGLDIIMANDIQTIYESYALAKAGDVIMGKNDETAVTHLRMVAVDAVVARNNSGEINPHRSYLQCVEQTDTFDSTRKDVKTTWWMDHKYTFDTLAKAGWIAVTFECYETNTSLIPYIALDQEITPDMLSKGNLNGTVSSDYPIAYIHMSIYDKSGNLVNRVVKSNPYEGRKETLRKHTFTLFTDDLKAGTEYTFVLDAGIARGNAEICRVDFTYKK